MKSDKNLVALAQFSSQNFGVLGAPVNSSPLPEERWMKELAEERRELRRLEMDLGSVRRLFLGILVA